MGLDMNAIAIRYASPSIVDDLPFYGHGPLPEGTPTNCTVEGPQEGATEFAYWRKHPNLHGWMYELAREHGFSGGPQGFNCVWLRLRLEDINRLERDMNNSLSTMTGFFFGQSQDHHETYTRQFIKSARHAMKLGVTIFYDSWW